MISVRHRAIHENRPYVVWQLKEPGRPTRYAATFDINRESVVPTSFPHPTMFRAVDAMLETPAITTTPEPAIKPGQLSFWN
jgi:hypothetical protein